MHVDMQALAALTSEKSMPIEGLITAIELGVLTAYNELPEAKPRAFSRLNRETGDVAILVPIYNEEG